MDIPVMRYLPSPMFPVDPLEARFEDVEDGPDGEDAGGDTTPDSDDVSKQSFI